MHLGCRHGNIKGSCSDRQEGGRWKEERGGRRDNKGPGLGWDESKIGKGGRYAGEVWKGKERERKISKERCLSPPTSYTSARASDPALYIRLPFLHPSAPFAPPSCAASASSSLLTVHSPLLPPLEGRGAEGGGEAWRKRWPRRRRGCASSIAN